MDAASNRLDDSAPRPDAIVLCRTLTGLATVRALGQAGIRTHAFVFDARDPVRASRYAASVWVGTSATLSDVLKALIDLARRLGGRPVIFPTSDRHALFLAEHAAVLNAVARVSTTTHEDLRAIIDKHVLYRRADELGVPTVPWIHTTHLDALHAWCDEHSAPYLIKPFFHGSGASPLVVKNVLCADRAALMASVRTHGLDGVLVQRMIEGGDGYIHDVYGATDRDGRVVCLASHRRIRQAPADFGTTSYGVIPTERREDEARLFAQTRALLAGMRFNGVFGIEWLRDRRSGAFYMIDFNARPFLTIGHLLDCGLNLPAIAYAVLVGDDLSNIVSEPTLTPMLWIDLVRDLQSRSALRAAGRPIGAFSAWLREAWQCRSAAYWRWRDPGPGVRRTIDFVRSGVRYTVKRAFALRASR